MNSEYSLIPFLGFLYCTGLLGFSPFNTIIYQTKEIALWVLKRFLSPILGYREFEAFVSVGGLEYEEPQVGFVANIHFEDL